MLAMRKAPLTREGAGRKQGGLVRWACPCAGCADWEGEARAKTACKGKGRGAMLIVLDNPGMLRAEAL